MVQAMGALSAALPDWHPDHLERADWDHPEILHQAFEKAGFSDIEVEERQVDIDVDVTPEQAWHGMVAGFAPLALAKQTMAPDVWQAAKARGVAWMAENPQPQQSYMALFAKGRA
jgi:hypothetical protein